jgi:NAD(P)-dependent dehydrogenase (short-subunit alcohol dehydrogenase family)
VILVTGANKGLGKETVRQLVVAGHRVFLAARDEQRGRMAATETGAQHIALDVTSDSSVDAAARRIAAEAGRLDVLINNAGTTGDLTRETADVDASDMLAVYDTNVIGAVRVIHAFLPLLSESAAPTIVNVSSGMGSLTWATDPSKVEASWPSVVYASSKSALNMVTVQYAKVFPNIRVLAVDPGLTATDGTGGMGKPLEEGVVAIVRAALDPDAALTGRYTNAEGPIPW